MFWYIGAMISGLIVSFGVIWRCNCHHKKRNKRKITEYRKSLKLDGLHENESITCNQEKVSTENVDTNAKLCMAKYSPFPLLDGLNPKTKSNLMMKEPIRVFDSAEIIKIVNSRNYYFTDHSHTWNRIITSSDTEDSDEMYEVTTHNDNCVIQFSL